VTLRRLSFATLCLGVLGHPVLAQTPDARVAAAGRLHAVGRAVVEVAPDLASVSVGVNTRAATPTEALDRNSAAARRAIELVRSLGVGQPDIATGSVTLSEAFRTTGQGQVPDGFQASNTVTIRVRDLGRLGEIMRRVVEQGANRVGGVTFGLSDQAKFADQARAAAVEDALRKARGLASAAGVKLGPIEQISFPPRTEFRSYGDGAADMPSRQRVLATVPIEVGTVEVSAEVDMTWALDQP
jgi:uncharacterized protein YggE